MRLDKTLVSPGAWSGALLLVALSASGCTDPNSFAPACPVSEIVPEAGDITRWRGSGHDVTDLALSGKITGVKADCFAGEKPGTIRGRVQVQLALNRGPAASGRSVSVQYFVAVTRGQNILDKAVYPIQATFPPNVDTLSFTGEEVNLVFPTPKGVSGPDYTVEYGFQLSPEELAANRAKEK